MGKILETVRELVDRTLSSIVRDLECRCNPTLLSAINYALFPGGKRIKPIACIKAFEYVGGKGDKILLYACALEMIHTASLIKDDLPAMDNHQERRGKPSLWKHFGEATAMMAADMLSTEAYRILLCQFNVYPLIEVLNAVISMINGQGLDCLGIKGSEVNRLKTASLFEAAYVIGGVIGGGTEEQVAALRLQGYRYGLEFQILDDIKDRDQDELSDRPRLA